MDHLINVVVHLCVCLYVCNYMEKNLYLFETPMYFRNYYLIVFLLWVVFQGELHMSSEFGENIQSIKGVHQNVVFICSNIWTIII